LLSAGESPDPASPTDAAEEFESPVTESGSMTKSAVKPEHDQQCGNQHDVGRPLPA
jgi:hypothetical protein